MKSEAVKENPLSSIYVLPIPRETFEKLNKHAIALGMNFPEFLVETVSHYLNCKNK